MVHVSHSALSAFGTCSLSLSLLLWVHFAFVKSRCHWLPACVCAYVHSMCVSVCCLFDFISDKWSDKWTRTSVCVSVCRLATTPTRCKALFFSPSPPALLFSLTQPSPRTHWKRKQKTLLTSFLPPSYSMLLLLLVTVDRLKKVCKLHAHYTHAHTHVNVISYSCRNMQIRREAACLVYSSFSLLRQFVTHTLALHCT